MNMSNSSTAYRSTRNVPALATAFGNRGTESILAADDRVLVASTGEAPWRMICSLEIFAGDLQFVGTGWLAGPSTVVTAGHCVIDEQSMGGWATEIRVTPGRNGTDRRFGSFISRSFSSVSGWVVGKDRDQDYGAIHLAEPIGDELGWFDTAALPTSTLNGAHVNVSGYPADKGNGSEQHYHADKVIRAENRRIFYEVDTFGGQSGAPVFLLADASSRPMVVGIHAYGVGGTPTHFGFSANSGPRITPEVKGVLQEWTNRSGMLP